MSTTSSSEPSSSGPAAPARRLPGPLVHIRLAPPPGRPEQPKQRATKRAPPPAALSSGRSAARSCGSTPARRRPASHCRSAAGSAGAGAAAGCPVAGRPHCCYIRNRAGTRSRRTCDERVRPCAQPTKEEVSTP